jgi:hypothetical protein
MSLNKYITLLKTLSYISYDKRYNYIKNYIKIHKKKFKYNPKKIEINKNIILLFGKPKTAIFIDYKNEIGILCGFFLLKKIENGIIIFISKDEINNEQFGEIPKFVYEKYKINQLVFLNKIPISKNINKGPVIQIVEKTPPCKEILNKLHNIIKKSKINVQYLIRKKNNKNFKISYSPYFFDIFFMGLPYKNTTYKAQNIRDFFKLIYYCMIYL